jgi:hypothetical protein
MTRSKAKQVALAVSAAPKRADETKKCLGFEDLAPRIRFWRESLEQFLDRGPHTRGVRKHFLNTIANLERWETYCLGEISESEFFGLYPEKYKAPFLPWIGPRITFELVDAIWTAEHEKSGTPNDFVKWVEFHFTSAGGHPVDLALYNIAQKAVVLRKDKLPWMKIAHKLCPSKQKDSQHRCTKSCADKIRLAVAEFEEVVTPPPPPDKTA